MDKFSELKAAIPANVKSRESVAAGFVTHNNTGGYFVIECQECGAVYPSQQADGGGQIADTGDYNDAICPHCGEESPEECENVGLVWNVQQAKIIALLAELEANNLQCSGIEQERELFRIERAAHQQHAQELEKRIAELECQLQSGFTPEALAQEERAENAEQRVAELEAKLATPVRLPSKNDDEFWFDGVFQVAKFDRAVERSISAAGFKFAGDE